MADHLDINSIKTKHFNLFYMKGNAGDYASLKLPAKEDPEYGLIESGSYYRLRQFVVVIKGSFEQDYIEGPRRYRPYGSITKEFFRSGPYMNIAREDGSVCICFTPRDRTIFWQRQFVSLKQGETFTVPADEKDRIIFPTKGKIRVNDTRINKRKLYNLTENKEYVIEPLDEQSDFVFAYQDGEYIPEIEKNPDLSDEIFLEGND